MTDIFDRAQDLEAWQRETAITEARSRAPHGASRTHCEDCGDEISPERRHASPGCTRCLDCQQDHELEQAMRGRR